MLNASLLFYFVIFQRLSKAQLSCVVLDETNACGSDYTGYPISNPNITSTKDFNEMISNLNQVRSYSVFGCSSTDINEEAISAVRYQTSFWCSYHVHAAIEKGCSVDNAIRKSMDTLCQPQCFAVKNSVRILFSKCTNNEVRSLISRRKYTSFLDNTCNLFAAEKRNSSRPSCSKGTDKESQLCGWNSNEVAMKNCQKMPTTECCSKLLKLSQVDNEKEPQESKTSDSSSKLSFAGWEIALIVIGILIFFAILILYLTKRNKNSKKRFDSSSEKDMDASASTVQNDILRKKMPEQIPKILENLESQIKEDTLLFSDNDRLTKFLDRKNETAKTDKSSKNEPDEGDTKRSDTTSIKSYTNSLSESGNNKMLIVVEEYKSSNSDEIDLKLGDHIYCLQEFDDGWALGCNPITEQQGVFPLTFTKPKNNDSYVEFLSKKISYISYKKSSSINSVMSTDSLGRNPFRGKELS